MSAICCPQCNRALPAMTRRCAHCGFSSGIASDRESVGMLPVSVKLRLPLSLLCGNWWRRSASGGFVYRQRRDFTPLSGELTDSKDPSDEPATVEIEASALEDLRPERQITWRHVVEVTTEQIPVYPPRPALPAEIRIAPPVSQVRKRMFPPRTAFWGLCLIIIVAVSITGVLVASGRGIQPSLSGTEGLALVVSPHTVAIGATLSLRGSGFTANGYIGLTRASVIPIVNTAGDSVIRADELGNFSDTVVVRADWGASIHTISAEDATTHKVATFPVEIVGTGLPLRPAHLEISTTTLDMGSGDQATNSTLPVTLRNEGDGQISWQGSTTQSWLKIGPEAGTIYGGMLTQITIAVSRANLTPGSYSGQVLFSSDAGDVSVAVQMQVTQLDPGNRAVLQVTPAVLSFVANDGAAAPGPQLVTVSNPGIRPLEWQVTTGESWLTASIQEGILPVQASTSVSLTVDTRTLLPGTYHTAVEFSAQDSLHTPQPVDVYITITPGCLLTFSPIVLSFSSAYGQPAPSPKNVDLTTSADCAQSLSWQVRSTESWLTIDRQSGATPETLAVGIKVDGLAPGDYTGMLHFTSPAGTQTLLVKFMLGSKYTPVLTVTSSLLSFHGTIGTSGPAVQTITLTNTGSGGLNWSTTASGGDWLSVSPRSGWLEAQQSTSIQISAELLSSLMAGSYSGTVVFSGTDTNGNAVIGTPQTLPVSFVVRSPCSLQMDRFTLTFNGAGGQPLPDARPVHLSVSDACVNDLSWQARITTERGGSWLTAETSGTVGKGNSTPMAIGIASANLPTGTYQGTIALTATDRVTGKTVVAPRPLSVTLTMSNACTLQAPDPVALSFTAPRQTKTFSVSVTGTCSGGVTVTPTLVAGSNWLTISPATVRMNAGEQALFTLEAKSTTLQPGQYTDTIVLAGTSRGISIIASPQSIAVALNVGQAPTLAVSPTTLAFGNVRLTESMSVALRNTGNGALNWRATLATGVPSFLSLTTSSGSGLVQGTIANLIANVDATGQQSGQYTTSISISATDAATGQNVAGSPVTIPVTITIPPPAMQLSNSLVTLHTIEGNGSVSGMVQVTNSGGGRLTWITEMPAQPWLLVSPANGATTADASSTFYIQANVAGLAASSLPYRTTFTVVPSAGNPMIITVELFVESALSSPTVISTIDDTRIQPTIEVTTTIVP